MKLRHLLLLTVGVFISALLIAQEDVIVIDGGASNGGSIETTINGDTLADGTRANPNRIYELKAGEFYLQHSAINVNNPDGTITIRGQEGGRKPVIIKQPLNEVAIGTNQINSSYVVQNVHWQVMQTDNVLPWSHTNINGDNHTLLVEDCFYEFCNGIIWNMNNVQAGAEATIRNSYFRDMQNGSGSQWWAGRVLQNKVPTDLLIFENNTVTGGGLTILPQECLIEYAVINHNTFINNRKYVCLNQYWKEVYFTNNLFVNANWVGEDRENVATGGQDPDGLLHGLSGVDTIETSIWMNPKFITGDSTLTDEVDEISDYIYYAADNVVVASATLDNYYSGGMNDVIDGAPASYLDWGGMGTGPWTVVNVPGIWSNERTQAMLTDWDNLKEENNSIYEHTAEDLGFGTTILSQAGADILAQWNQNKWAVPDVESPTEGWAENVHFGDYDPTTVPGIETENAPAGEGGISKISDLLEDFTYTMTLTSKSDGTPIGAHTWWDVEWDSETMTQRVKDAYNGIYIGVEEVALTADELQLRNYPNPFSVSTNISFNLPKNSHVNLSVFDISGRLVKTLINENRTGGQYVVQFTPEFGASSTYFYKLTTDYNTVTRKMTFLR